MAGVAFVPGVMVGMEFARHVARRAFGSIVAKHMPTEGDREAFVEVL